MSEAEKKIVVDVGPMLAAYASAALAFAKASDALIDAAKCLRAADLENSSKHDREAQNAVTAGFEAMAAGVTYMESLRPRIEAGELDVTVN